MQSRDGREWGLALQLHALSVQALTRQERYADALAATHVGLAEVSAQLGSVRLKFNLMSQQSVALRHLGRLEESLQAARLCYEIGRDTGIVRSQVVALTEIAETALAMSDLTLAASTVDEARLLAQTLDKGYFVPRIVELDGILARERGDLATARAAFEEALRLFAARGVDTSSVCGQLAALHFAEGQLADALAIVEALLADATTDGRPDHRAVSSRDLVTCFTVLRAAEDGRVTALRDDLAERLSEQLAALSDEAQRIALLTRVPWWRDTQRLLDAG